MQQIEINNLITFAENHSKCIAYAESIVKAQKEMREAQKTLNENCDTWTSSEWLDSYSEVEKMQKSITMKIKHFFDMVYGKENSFCETLKGKDSIEHWLTFYEFANNFYCNCKI